jgi:formimidoylglutamate deiminase
VVDPAALPPDGEVVRLPRRALFPGSVNAHSHAFQRLIRGRTEFVSAGHAQDDFWSWRELMYRAAGALTPEDVYVASRQAFVEMARAGFTTVGEFHYLHHGPDGTPYADRNELALQVVRAAKDVGVRLVLLRVGYARAGFGVAENPRQKRFIDPDVETFLGTVEALAQAVRGEERGSVGIAPHSVRAAPLEWLREIAKAPAARRGPSVGATHASPFLDPTWVVHKHVSEQPAEIAACVTEHGLRPVELLAREGLLGPRFTAVHGIHLTDEEVQLLGQARANVCACPSTERNLGDGVIPADLLLKAGAQVCLGTDSQAQIDWLEDARQLESHLRLVRLRRAVLDPGQGDPDGLARVLFEAATTAGARSLGVDTGALTPGAPADFFTVDLDHPSLAGGSSLGAVVFGAERSAIVEVAVQGELIVREGQHRLERDSGQAFTALARRIFA